MILVSLKSVLALQFSYGSCITFPYLFALERWLPEMQALGHALGHAGRLQSLIYPIHTVITFDRFARFRIPLGRTPWTGRDTAFAADTERFIDANNAILGPFLYGAGGTG